MQASRKDQIFKFKVSFFRTKTSTEPLKVIPNCPILAHSRKEATNGANNYATRIVNDPSNNFGHYTISLNEYC